MIWEQFTHKFHLLVFHEWSQTDIVTSNHLIRYFIYFERLTLLKILVHLKIKKSYIIIQLENVQELLLFCMTESLNSPLKTFIDIRSGYKSLFSVIYWFDRFISEQMQKIKLCADKHRLTICSVVWTGRKPATPGHHCRLTSVAETVPCPASLPWNTHINTLQLQTARHTQLTQKDSTFTTSSFLH